MMQGHNRRLERRNATKPGFQRFNQVLLWHELEMKDGSEEKKMPLFWLQWLHVDCDVCMVITKHTG